MTTFCTYDGTYDGTYKPWCENGWHFKVQPNDPLECPDCGMKCEHSDDCTHLS